jgi:hypothetical protein
MPFRDLFDNVLGCTHSQLFIEKNNFPKLFDLKNLIIDLLHRCSKLSKVLMQPLCFA